MTSNLPAVVATNLPLTPFNVALWPRHELERHRANICLRMEAFLANGYWQDLNMSEEVKTIILADWADALQDWSMDRIKAALITWQDDNPRLKPTPGDIKAILKAEWGREKAPEVRRLREADQRPQAVDRPDPERRRAISADLAKSFPGLIKPIPRVQE